MNAWKTSGAIALLAAGCFYAGGYVATTTGFTEQQKENIQILKNVKALRDSFNAQQSEPKAAPVQAAPPAPVDRPAKFSQPESTTHTLVENIRNTSPSQLEAYRKKAVDYTDSDQEQMRVVCSSDVDGAVTWQAGIETYTVNGVQYAKLKMVSQYSIGSMYKEQGYKCTTSFAAKLGSFEDLTYIYAGLSDDNPHNTEEFKDLRK